jgi:hemerythrin-like domain-containing protein
MSPHAHAKMPLDMLREEHVVILRVVDALERWLDRLEAEKSAPAEALENAVAFLKGFADGCHHRKEEELLFPALEEGGPFGPVSVMLEEHEEGRGYVQGLSDGLHQLESDSGRNSVLANGRHYVALLRAHIDKENEVLFPLSERMLSADAMHGLAHAFEDVEAEQAGDHETFLALVSEIERGAGA